MRILNIIKNFKSNPIIKDLKQLISQRAEIKKQKIYILLD